VGSEVRDDLEEDVGWDLRRFAGRHRSWDASVTLTGTLFAARIADEARDGDTRRVPPVLIQPIAADDVAAAVCNVMLAAPLCKTIEIAEPEP
jgi:hypothetical protein